MDFLRYFYQVASPFVMISEIELAIRALIRIVLDGDKLIEAAKRCLSKIPGGEDKVPRDLEEMSFENYRSIVSHAGNWEDFSTVFGGNRVRTSGKLKEIGAIRNDVFHFKREKGVGG